MKKLKKKVLNSFIKVAISLSLILGCSNAVMVNADTTDKPVVAKGIDISYWQGNLDFNEIESKVDYAILRAGYGKSALQVDKKFNEYYNQANAVGLPIGAYWFSYANSVEDAKKEAYACLEVLSGKQFEYPIYYDIEEPALINKSSSELVDIVDTFCNILEENGYYVGVYTYSWLADTKLNDDRIDQYDNWLADVMHSTVNYRQTIGMWQYKIDSLYLTNKEYTIDFNYSYKDYPKLIRKAHRNNLR